jgi:hypothetical protein
VALQQLIVEPEATFDFVGGRVAALEAVQRLSAELVLELQARRLEERAAPPPSSRRRAMPGSAVSSERAGMSSRTCGATGSRAVLRNFWPTPCTTAP